MYTARGKQTMTFTRKTEWKWRLEWLCGSSKTLICGRGMRSKTWSAATVTMHNELVYLCTLFLLFVASYFHPVSLYTLSKKMQKRWLPFTFFAHTHTHVLNSWPLTEECFQYFGNRSKPTVQETDRYQVHRCAPSTEKVLITAQHIRHLVPSTHNSWAFFDLSSRKLFQSLGRLGTKTGPTLKMFVCFVFCFSLTRDSTVLMLWLD